MELQTYSESSRSLARRIEEVVRSRTGVAICNLQVDVSGDQVTLSGRTATYYHKQLATHAVLHAIAERTLCNEIEVGSL